MGDWPNRCNDNTGKRRRGEEVSLLRQGPLGEWRRVYLRKELDKRDLKPRGGKPQIAIKKITSGAFTKMKK